MHGTATGKAMLAFSDPGELRTLLDLPRGGRLPRLTAATITSLAELQRDLEQTRTRGYSISRGESMESAWGVAAPVLDVTGRPVAILTLWGPPERVTEDRLHDLGKAVRRAGEEIAGRLSPPG